MEPIKDNQIVIKDDEGNEYLFNILFTFVNEKRNTEYVYIYSDENEEEVYCMKYNDNHELEYIEDEDEMAEVEEVLEAYNEDPQIQEIKE